MRPSSQSIRSERKGSLYRFVDRAGTQRSFMLWLPLCRAALVRWKGVRLSQWSATRDLFMHHQPPDPRPRHPRSG